MPHYTIKTEEEIAKMRESCRILAQILEELKKMVRPGITTKDLDLQARKLIKQFHVISSFKGYRGYPSYICTNVNEQVVHAIPNDRILQEGDIISIDAGVIYEGFHSDSAITVGVGEISSDAKKFISVAEEALKLGIAQARPGNKIGDIGFVIQRHVESHNYGVVREFVGHGIGRSLHEPPEIPNFGQKGKGPLLVPGMIICIEPIITMGGRFTNILGDGWTAVTRDNSLACQVEHTVLITPNGPEVLTG